MKILGYEISIKKSAKISLKKGETINNPPIVESAIYSQETMKLTYSDGTIEEFDGECTVWRLMPMMGNISTAEEFELLRIWKYIKKYGNPYPTAHLKEKE